MNKIMTHFVVGFPTMEKSFAAVEAAIEGGASFIELQFPFSDPTADGVLIQDACAVALEQGFRVADGFDFVEKIREKYIVPVFVMSYAGLVFAYGVENFVKKAKSSGVSGLIVPDFPFDYDAGLYQACRESGVHAVAVVLPSIEESRLEQILSLDQRYIYVAIRAGITGQESQVSGEITAFLQKIRRRGKFVLAGFGISSPQQVAALATSCDACVVGSAIVKRLTESPDSLEELKSFVKNLSVAG
ncbi:MAG: tryptophan synthase subunit alpha [Spirochaetales bacterium]|nr:tryptophan synthase subunit alpha [Spirochaetales bacterium]